MRVTREWHDRCRDAYRRVAIDASTPRLLGRNAMFSMLLPLEASDGRRAERPNLPPADNPTNPFQRWLRAIRVALGLKRA